MKWFKCSCGAAVYFDNVGCLTCGKALGFLADERKLVALEPTGDGQFTTSEVAGVTYRQCENYAVHGVCNWMVRSDQPHTLCISCRLNEVIPDLSLPENREKWARIEAAKRRLVFTLLGLSLKVVPKLEDPEGLAFDLKANTPSLLVFTGHDNGLITLNIAEADPIQREQARVALNERYRTLLGHLRHESGHYYWDRLIQNSPLLLDFRALFGDEQLDYAEALRLHYESGGRSDWAGNFVSAYATSHPWEDWAETFAHYLHMVDTLETADAFGIRLPGSRLTMLSDSFDVLMNHFVELTVVLNALNRSMGQEDAYPFTIGDGAKAKLAFVHDVIAGQRALLRAA